MHIAMIAPEQIPVPTPGGGSVEICMMAIAKRLARRHQVTLFSRRHPRYPHVSRHGNLTIVRVASGSSKRYIAGVAKRMSGRTFDWIQIDNRPRFAPVIKERFPHTPVSVFLHSLTFVSQPMISHDAAAHCLARADMIVANSSSLRARLQERFPQLAAKIRTVHLGVDLRQFRPPTEGQRAALRRRFGVSGSFVVAFAGRIIPRKGIPVLLRAFRKVKNAVPSARLLIAGGCPKPAYKAKLMRMARKLKLGARFVGIVPHRRMQDVYRAADCFVCPSQKHEAFGLVNVEAMACGIPSVASSNGGIREVVVHERNGLLVHQYANPASFAEPLIRLARDRTFARRLGRQAREDAANRFGWKQTAESLGKLYGRAGAD